MDSLTDKRTVERHQRQERRHQKRGGYGATKEYAAVASGQLPALTECIRARLEHDVELYPFMDMLRQVDPGVIADIGFAELGDALRLGRDGPAIQVAIGRWIEAELWVMGLDPKLAERIYNSSYPRRAARRRGYRDEWPEDLAYFVGDWVVDCVVRGLPAFYEQRYDEARKDWVTDIRLEARDQVEALREQVMWRDPAWSPTLQKPIPWTGLRQGGYAEPRMQRRLAFVITHYDEVREAVDDAFRSGSIKPHVDAVNRLQAVPFKLNEVVFGAAKRHLPGMLKKAIVECKEALAKAERDLELVMADLAARPLWAICDEDAEADAGWYNAARARLVRAKIDLKAAKHQYELAKDDLRTAEELTADKLKGAPLYLPMVTDFRGRCYAVPHLNYRRGDYVRSLFLFHRGRKITGHGLRWLAIYVASVGGFRSPDIVAHPDDFFTLDDPGPECPAHEMRIAGKRIDKASYPERWRWTMANMDFVRSTARQETTDWLNAKEPWAFLAACTELVAAASHERPEEYITHLPIYFDATNSAIQHQAALIRDKKAGASANLCPCEIQPLVYERDPNADWTVPGGKLLDVYRAPGSQILDPPQDSYRDPTMGVADEIRGQLPDLRLERGDLKQAIMTTNYGSTNHGRARQIEKALRNRGKEIDFRDVLKIAKLAEDEVGKHFDALGDINKLLVACVAPLAERNAPLRWTSPSGFPVVNAYRKIRTARIPSLRASGSREVVADGHDPNLLPIEAKRAVTANFVHSLDASLLALTVNACADAEITDLVTVHDCFGVLAPDADDFNRIVREQFVSMYQDNDPLKEIRDHVEFILSDPASGTQMREAFSRAIKEVRANNGGKRATRLADLAKQVNKALDTPAAQLLPSVPPRGELDLRDILSSPYFVTP
jgi:DNA-directed RNA polymerase